MVGDHRQSRRRVLTGAAGILGGGVAGCLGSDSDGGGSDGDGSDGQDSDGTGGRDGSGGDSEDEQGIGTADVTPDSLETDGDWPMQNRDARNTGYASAIGGPDGPVERLWSYDLPGLGTPAVRDGTVYAQSESGTCVALDLLTGEEIWTTEFGDGTVHGRLAIATSDEAVFAYDGDIHAIDRTSGETTWTTSGSGQPKFRIDDGVLYVVSSRTVQALDAATGEEVGFGDLYLEDAFAVDLCVVGERIYVSGGDFVLGLDADTGEELWREQRKGPRTREGGVIGGVCVANGSVYATLHEMQRLLCLDGETGSVTWERDLPCLESPAFVDGTLYVSTLSPGLRAIDAETGEDRREWSVDVTRDPHSAPSVTSDSVYFLAGGWYDQRLAAFEPTTGDVQWSVETTDKMGPMAVTEDVLVLRGKEKGAVVALTAGQS